MPVQSQDLCGVRPSQNRRLRVLWLGGQAGRLLAHVLLQGGHGDRPVTLVGHSMGARVIFHCLLELCRHNCKGALCANVYHTCCNLSACNAFLSVLYMGTYRTSGQTRMPIDISWFHTTERCIAMCFWLQEWWRLRCCWERPSASARSAGRWRAAASRADSSMATPGVTGCSGSFTAAATVRLCFGSLVCRFVGGPCAGAPLQSLVACGCRRRDATCCGGTHVS